MFHWGMGLKWALIIGKNIGRGAAVVIV